MGGVKSQEKTVNEDGTTTYYYEQKVPIPAYLIAIVAGNLVSRKIGPRSSVWCEEEMVEKAQWEFEEVRLVIKLSKTYFVCVKV